MQSFVDFLVLQKLYSFKRLTYSGIQAVWNSVSRVLAKMYTDHPTISLVTFKLPGCKYLVFCCDINRILVKKQRVEVVARTRVETTGCADVFQRFSLIILSWPQKILSC